MWALLLPFLLVTGPANALPSLEDYHQELMRQLRRTKKPRPPAEDPARFDYLLVGGIVSDYLHHVGYFREFTRELVSEGVPAKQIQTLFPPSHQSVEHNVANALPAAWAKLIAKSDRPIVIIAHSKGAVEMVNFLLANPELQDRVEAIHCIQGAFGGSELADFLMKEYDQPGRPERLWPRTGMRIFRLLDRVLHGRIAGVESLTTARARERVMGWYREHSEGLKKIVSKVIFTTTYQEPQKMDLRLRVGGNYLESVGALDNDGAVAEKNQFITGLADRVVSISGIDHSLPCGNLIARRHTDTAKALIRAVLRSIGK